VFLDDFVKTDKTWVGILFRFRRSLNGYVFFIGYVFLLGMFFLLGMYDLKGLR
jgi:hypothetical protein